MPHAMKPYSSNSCFKRVRGKRDQDNRRVTCMCNIWNMFSVSDKIVVFIEQHVSAYMVIFRLTYMFFNYCTVVTVQYKSIYIDIVN
jgi:hypothetical protein